MKKSIAISLTKSDRDIISWVNMMIEDNQSPFKWLEALLIADMNQESLELGKIVRQHPEPNTQRNFLDIPMFDFNDSDSENTKPSRKIRGPNNEYIEGSQLVLQIRIESVIQYLSELKKRGIKLSPYIKMLIRKNIVVANDGSNEPPNEAKMKQYLFEKQIDEKRKTTTLYPELTNMNHPQTHKQKMPILSTTTLSNNDSPKAVPKSKEPNIKKRNPLLDYIS